MSYPTIDKVAEFISNKINHAESPEIKEQWTQCLDDFFKEISISSEEKSFSNPAFRNRLTKILITWGEKMDLDTLH